MRPRRCLSRIGSLFALLAAAAAAQQPQPAPRYQIVDGHLHFLSFVQETDGMAALFKAMDDTGVAESVVIGMPVVKVCSRSIRISGRASAKSSCVTTISLL
jgi:hypothetical protein